MSRSIALVVAAWLAAHVLLILASVLEVAIWSMVFAPGLPEEAYQAHAQQTAPWVSVVLGAPVFYGLSRLLLGRGLGPRAPWAVWALYTALDLTVVLAVGELTSLLAGQWLASQSLKALGVWAATRSAPSSAEAEARGGRPAEP